MTRFNKDGKLMTKEESEILDEENEQKERQREQEEQEKK